MSTISIKATTERPAGTLQAKLSAVPWLTVVPLAALMAFADGFWLTSLRGAVGSIERSQTPFASWLGDSALVLPVFVLAVLAALALAARWFGPVLSTPKTIIATGLLIVAAGTLVGIAAVAVSSAYDYHLQTSQIMVGMGSMSDSAALALQVRALGFASGILLVTNLALVGWVLAIRGGRLNVSKTSH